MARRRGCLFWLGLLCLAAAIWLWRSPDYLPRILRPRPTAIIIHHSASAPVVGGRPVDAATIDAMHARRGFHTVYRGRVYHIGYHYVVLQDGTVQRGRPEGCIGAHARHVNDRSLGICLVGNFSSTENPDGRQGPVRPPDAQLASLTALCAYLVRKYDIPLEQIRRHRDVGRTACPGDRFPWRDFQRALRRELGMTQE